MKVVKKSKKGVDYIAGVLEDKKTVLTRAVFYKVPHGQDGNLGLKLGRYNKGKTTYDAETLVCSDPRSELTLSDVEFKELITFLEDNYEPLLQGAGKYVKADANLDTELAEKLAAIFGNKDYKKVADFLLANNLLSENVTAMIEYSRRDDAIEEFREKLDNNEVEYEWQKWFEKNDWVLGNEFAQILDERSIDTHNVADYLVETSDGFVDLIEIKRPKGGLKFWSATRDHDNLIPHHDLIAAVSQVQNYVQELESEMDSIKMKKNLSGATIIKPRATLIFGRSKDWGDDEKKAFRLLNAGYQNLTIFTYDHILSRAERSLLQSRRADRQTSE